MPGKAIKSTNKKGGKHLKPGPHTKSSLNGTISSSLNKKVADKQKEKEKRTKEKSKRAEHDPDVSKLKHLSQPEKVHFPGPNQLFQKTYEISEIGPVYLDWGKKRVKNSKGKIVRVSTFTCFISKTDRFLGVLYQEGQQASYLGQMGRRIQRSI